MRRYRQRVAIQTPIEHRQSDGGVYYTYETVAGLESVPAMIMTRAMEQVENDKTVETTRFQIILSGYHPQIVVEMVVLDGIGVYDIEMVTPLTGKRSTYIIAQLVSI